MKPWSFVQSFFDKRFFFPMEMSLFPIIFVPVAFPLCKDSTSYIFPIFLPDGLFLSCDHELDFLSEVSANYVRIQSINKKL